VRIISATNRNLAERTREGQFREDLYYRLNVFPIYVPALRQRREDIAELTRHFVSRFAAEENKPICGLSEEAAGLIQNFDWPGNVRQLENTIFRAVVLCDGDVLDACDFPQIAAAAGVEIRSRNIGAATEPVQLAPSNGSFDPAPAGPLAVPAINDTGHVRRLDDIEAQVIRMAIDHYDGHMSEVARRLGIGRSTLYRKLKEFGLDHMGRAEELAIEPLMQAAT
jgi:DNA-binding NtrC family response regulator